MAALVSFLSSGCQKDEVATTKPAPDPPELVRAAKSAVGAYAIEGVRAETAAAVPETAPQEKPPGALSPDAGPRREPRGVSL